MGRGQALSEDMPNLNLQRLTINIHHPDMSVGFCVMNQDLCGDTNAHVADVQNSWYMTQSIALDEAELTSPCGVCSWREAETSAAILEEHSEEQLN